MHDQCLNYFWRQEVLLVCRQLPEQVYLHLPSAVLVGQLGQLHHEHEAQEGQLLVLVVENQQWEQVLLQEVPAAQGCPHEWLRLVVELQVLEELFETLLAVLALDVDVEAADLLDAADTLHPE